MDFGGFDPAAELQIDGEVLTLRFRFPDASAARAAAEALVASHARGEAVVITLSSGENDMGILQ